MDIGRRHLIGGLALGAGAIAASQSRSAEGDGHAEGGSASPSSTYVRTIPRKSGAGQAFTAALDTGPIKATAGGWARDITATQLPIATGIAGAHLFLNPGGVREMHWHSSAEWGYIIAGQCQATVVDPDGVVEVVNFGPGDTWSFPAGHAHAIQALGPLPCHAVLAFDDGLYGEHGTFGLTDWLSRLGAPVLQAAFGLSGDAARGLPEGEAYIAQGPVVPLDGAVARSQIPLDAVATHRFPLSGAPARDESPEGSIRVAPAQSFPVSSTMTGFLEVIAPGGLHGPHWHPVASEWHFLIKGRTRVTLYGADKRLGVAEMKPGDCAYFPRAAAHMIENIGPDPCELVGVHNAGTFQECSLAQWLSRVPRQILAANLGLPESAFDLSSSAPKTFVRTAAAAGAAP